MSNYLVVGAGCIGATITRLLVDRGDTVTVATRRGTVLPGALAVRVDAADAVAVTRVARGKDAIVNCANPPYGKWATLWPPIFAAMVGAAGVSEAALVTIGNLYPYGRARMPMTENSPERPADHKGEIRQDGWALAKAAHDAGEIRAVEVRASDYFGPGAGAAAHLGRDFFVPLMTGAAAKVVGDPAQPHSWAYLPDIAATAVAALDFTGEWGRIWHVPAASQKSRVEIADQLSAEFGATGRLSAYPSAVLALAGLFSLDIREVRRSSYQFTGPFISSAAITEQELGVSATPWRAALTATVDSYR